MSAQLDLQEQEQLDALKSFWKQYGNLITLLLTAVMLVYLGWFGWQWYQRDQAAKAGSMFTELERAALANDDEKTTRIFNDIKERHGSSAYAQQAGLVAAKLQYDKGQADAAKASLTWVAEKATEDEYKTVARLRLAGVQMDAKQYDEALKTLDAATAPSFAALVADRRGDVLMAQGKRDEAKAAYQAAYKGLDEKLDYRQLVDAKLTALGASPTAPAVVQAAAAAVGTAASAAAAGASR